MLRRALFTVMGLGLACTQTVGQEHYSEGPVWRMIFLRIKPGRMDAFFTDLRQNGKPVFEEDKRQKVLLDYKVYMNSSSSGPEDWNVAIGLEFANYAALDGLSDKITPISRKHYGSKEAQQEALEKRMQNADLVASRLVREINLK